MTECWFCGHEMIWQSDFNYDEIHGEGEGIVAYLSCPNCEAMAEFSLRDDDDEEESERKV